MAIWCTVKKIVRNISTIGLLILAATSPHMTSAARRHPSIWVPVAPAAMSLFSEEPSAASRVMLSSYTCKDPSIWVPVAPASMPLFSDTNVIKDWKRYDAGKGKPLVNRANQVYKAGANGGGMWYSIDALDNKLELTVHWGDRLYPGGNVNFAIYNSTSIYKKMCAASFAGLLPLPASGNVLQDGGPIDTTTMSFIKKGRTSSLSFPQTLSRPCLKGRTAAGANVRPYVVMVVLDYTNPKSRVLGRYFASNDGLHVTSDVICKSVKKSIKSELYFRWLIIGLACAC